MLAQMTPARTLSLRPRGLWTLFLALLMLTAGILAYLGITATRSALQTITSPDLSRLPLSFELNVGQTSNTVEYMARASGGTFFFTPSEIVLSLRGSNDAVGILRTSFVGANSQVYLSAGAALDGKANYLLGNDPSNWHTDVPTYAGVNYAQLYEGVDLAYSGTEGRLKSTYTVAPGADPAGIKWRYTGATSVKVDEAGNLQLALLSGDGKTITATEAAPVAWQAINGQNVPVSAQFTMLADGVVSFAVGTYNKSLPLIIDPTLVYSTYLGGSGFEYAAATRIDGQGNMYIGGQTASANFPITNAIQPIYGGGSLDAFVAKLNSTGTALIYSTFVGGIGEDGATDIQLNSSGEAYLVGFTASSSFPISNAIQPNRAGSYDAFVTKLNESGSSLLFSTYIGGSSEDQGTRAAIDSSGNIYLAGYTQSSDFPLQNPYQPNRFGIQDAFLLKILADGSALSYSTYFGGNAADAGYGAAVDSSGNAYLSGYTLSNDLPVPKGYQQTYGGGGDVFVTKFNTSGTNLVFSTYLGGSGNDVGEGVFVDSLGNAHVTGSTASTNFPTANAFQPALAGGDDAFITKLAASGSSLLYSSYMGGSQNDIGSDVQVNASDEAYVTGGTYSSNFPTSDAIQPLFAGVQDAFVAKLDTDGTIIYSTFLGGDQNDYGNVISLDGEDNAYVTGFTESTDFPTVAPFQPGSGGGRDAIVAKIYDLVFTPTPTETPTPTITPTSTPSDTPTPTDTPTATPTDTPTNTPTDTPTMTSTVTPTSCAIAFEDVPPNSTFYTFIRCLACQGIVNGYPCGGLLEPCVPPGNNPYFRVSSNVTRGQLSKIVSEAADFNDPVAGQTFEDVPEGSTFWVWIERLIIHEVMSGYPCGGDGEPCEPPLNRPYFRPNGVASRGQVTKIVSNAAGFDEDPSGQTFEDVLPGSTFYTYTQRLTSRLIMEGYPCGNPEPCVPPTNRSYFRPYANVTRGQSSKIVTNTFFPGCSFP